MAHSWVLTSRRGVTDLHRKEGPATSRTIVLLSEKRAVGLGTGTREIRALSGLIVLKMATHVSGIARIAYFLVTSSWVS